MSADMFRMSKKSVTRLFAGAIVALAAGVVLGVAALATDAIDLGGGSHHVDVNDGPDRTEHAVARPGRAEAAGIG